MNRRDFFQRALGLAGAAIAAQAVPVERALSAFSPELTQLRFVDVEMPAPRPGMRAIPCRISHDQLLTAWLNDLASQERRYPGISAALGKRLMVQYLGLPWENIRRALWKVLPDGPEADLDGWTHHARAVSEAGKP